MKLVCDDTAVLEGERHRSVEGGHRKLPGTAAESGQSEELKEICRGLPKVCDVFIQAETLLEFVTK